MSKKTLIEAVIAALLFTIEILLVLIFQFGTASIGMPNGYTLYIMAIFVNIDVIYGIILLIVNSHGDK